jgi:hypothetical protein
MVVHPDRLITERTRVWPVSVWTAVPLPGTFLTARGRNDRLTDATAIGIREELS